MILSKARRFVFVKGRKVAGTSIEIALSGICGPEDIITPIAPADELLRLDKGCPPQNYSETPEAEKVFVDQLREAARTKAAGLNKIQPPPLKYGNHMALKRLIRLYGDVRKDFEVVAIDRNPYSKVLSLANMAAAKNYNAKGVMKSTPEALQSAIGQLFSSGDVRKVQNLRLYKGPEGNFDVNQLMRYETLADDFANFLNRIGVPNPPVLPHAKKGIMSDTIDPREHFTKAQIRDINELFAEEFETYGYPMIAA